MPEPVVDPNWQPEEILPPWERARSRQPRPSRNNTELIAKSNAQFAQDRAGKVLIDALAKTLPGDKPTPQRPLAHYYFIAKDLRDRLDATAEANDLTLTERAAVLRYAFALFEEEFSADHPPELPIVAPRLWSDRSSSPRKIDPVSFTRDVYGPWLGKSLSRRKLRELDPDLYRALSVWEHRHPEQRIVELPTLAEEIDSRIEALSHEFSPDELRRLGSTLQTRHRRLKK